jgi:predicted alpha/beta-fold hydrolase
MPIIRKTYDSPLRFRLPFAGGHLSTIYPVITGKLPDIDYQKRLEVQTHDGDRVHLDFKAAEQEDKNTKAVLICPGLEATSQGPNEKGMVRAFNREGWDAFVLIYRGSSIPNLKQQTYHSGATEDLLCAIKFIN